MNNPQEPNGGWTEVLGGHASNPAEPRTSGDTLYALGREVKVSSCEHRIKAQFEQWVRSNAKRMIQETEQIEGPEEADRLRSIFTADFGGGAYSWDGRHCRQARRDFPGFVYLLYLLIVRCHPDITLDWVTEACKRHPKDCALAVRWALGNSVAPAANGTPTGEKTILKTLEGQEIHKVLMTKEEMDDLFKRRATMKKVDPSAQPS